MRVEALSLLPVEVNDDDVAMTTQEVRTIHEGLGVVYKEDEGPSGKQGPGTFDDI